MDMFEETLLKDKVILITGGGTGLGRAMGERFLELGAKLAITSRREDVLAKAAAEWVVLAKKYSTKPVMCETRFNFRKWWPLWNSIMAVLMY